MKITGGCEHKGTWLTFTPVSESQHFKVCMTWFSSGGEREQDLTKVVDGNVVRAVYTAVKTGSQQLKPDLRT